MTEIMKFQMYNQSYNLEHLAREAGYKPIGYTEKQELNAVRPLAGDYPRFHLYVAATPEIINFNLHLDQKKPVYEGTTAHSGDYESETVQDEAQRIKDVLFK